MRPIEGNLLDLPFKRESFHAGILRFFLLPKDDQPNVLKQIFDVLNPGARLIVLNHGVFPNNPNMVEDYNRLLAEGEASDETETAKNIRNERHFPSCEGFMNMAKDTRFSVEYASALAKYDFGYFSPKTHTWLLGLTRKQRRNLTGIFEELERNGNLSFEPGPRTPKQLYFVVLRKPEI